MKNSLQSPFFQFDLKRQLHVPSLDLTVKSGECVAILGAKGTDVSSIYSSFNRTDLLKQLRQKRLYGRKSNPVVHCVTHDGNLFRDYSALDNLLLADSKVFRTSRKQMLSKCDHLKKEFGITFDFTVPVSELQLSDALIVEVLRSYLFGTDILVCDNLFSILEIEDRRIFLRIVQAMLSNGGAVIYLTTKWENAVQVASRILVVMDNQVLGEVDSESAQKNPEHLIYLVSGRTLIEQPAEDQTANLLSMLYSGAEYLTDNYELDDALSFVCKNAEDALHCSSAQIYLSSESGEEIHKIVSNSPNTFALSPEFLSFLFSRSPGEGVFYANSDDVSFKSFFTGEPGSTRTLICLPISLKSETQGVLSITYNEYVVYDDHQFLYLSSFCKEINIILETSKLMGSSVLLQESNHRIKNNLQIIINLISMQRAYAAQNPTEDVNDALDSIINRIKVIATVHELLSSRDSGKSSINITTIIQRIADTVASQKINLIIKSDNILVPYSKATAISMVINELVTNSAKYAFRAPAPGRENTITISCAQSDRSVIITVADNGCGFSRPIDLEKSPSIGFSIVRTISKIDLHGTIKITSNPRGTSAVLQVPEFI